MVPVTLPASEWPLSYVNFVAAGSDTSVMTFSAVLAVALLVGFVLLCAGFLALVLRVGPKRGTWNQPAAAFVKPGRRLMISMYAVGIAHVILGIISAVAVPGGGIGVFLVLVATGAFYIVCAHSASIAARHYNASRNCNVERYKTDSP